MLQLLSPAQRLWLTELPDPMDERELARHYTLSEEDLAAIGKRRPETRTDITKGPGSRQAGLAMIIKSIEAAEGRWRKLTGAYLVALVRAGARFEDGELVEGSEQKVAA